MDTKLYGSLRVLKGALPSMRARKSGTVVTMSSVFGFVACPGAMAYNVASFALDGLGESLAADLAPFNIRSVVLLPGRFRTNVLASAHRPEAGSPRRTSKVLAERISFCSTRLRARRRRSRGIRRSWEGGSWSLWMGRAWRRGWRGIWSCRWGRMDISRRWGRWRV